MPQYLVAIHHPDNYDPSLEGEAMIRDIHALNEEMDAAGARLFAGGLEAPTRAKSVRRQPGGGVVVTDGPFLETKEHIGGFWILEAADMDAALSWGRKAAVAGRGPGLHAGPSGQVGIPPGHAEPVHGDRRTPHSQRRAAVRYRILRRNRVPQNSVRAIAINSLSLLVLLGTARQAMAQDATTQYPTMAPVGQYIMTDQGAEIALARSAAPPSIAREAEVWVLRRHGYETAVHGTNGFVCIVGRGWSAAADPDYWNPKVRVPMCVNAAAARSYLLRVTRITDLALAGRTLPQVNEAIAAALAGKELPPMESGAMCYMMSKEGYGGDSAPHWPSHLMFFYSDTDPASWGANLPGSPVFAVADPLERMTQFVLATPRWSDGTEDLSATATPAASSKLPTHEHP